jgi:hypothetical protein
MKRDKDDIRQQIEDLSRDIERDSAYRAKLKKPAARAEVDELIRRAETLRATLLERLKDN